jgi:apolipoprotein N-acyltransferase
MKLRKTYLILLSLLSGILLCLAWPVRGFPGLLFLGLVPLLALEDLIARNPERFSRFSVLFYSYPGFLLWNILTTWWIVNSTLVGAIIAVVLNSLFLSVVMQAHSWAKRALPGRLTGYLALVSFWLSFEYLHLNWILTWPWLNLGNGYASYYKWVQWYEYTGIMGGTLWVLIGNILMYEVFRNVKYSMKHSGFLFLVALLWIVIPIIISFTVYYGYTEKPDPVRFVVVQPNLDPYEEQYTVPPPEVIGRIMGLAVPEMDQQTNFLVAPESAIQENMWENDINTFASLRILKEVIRHYPNMNILIGGSTFRWFNPGESLTRSARKFSDSDRYYDAFNTAILINSSDSFQLYHKSKLTPGVEALPSFRGFKWLEKFALDLGGTVGSLGTDDLRKVYHTVETVPVSPIICYESVFGDFFAEFVRNGARIMIIITNDGWWGNTAGHRQHFAFSHLRAIETRRSIARSANTGISAFIDQRGDAHQMTPYWKPAVIKGTLNANDTLTFYTRHGDYLAVIAAWITAVLILISILLSLFHRKLTIRSQ